MNIRKAVLLALTLALCAAAPSGASEKRVKLNDLPAAVKKTVLEQSKGATLRGISQEVEKGKTYYEAELTVNKHHRDVLIDESGAIVEVEEEVPLASLPAAVTAGIEKQSPGSKILSAESISKNDKIVAYEAVVLRNGKKKEIKVGPDGKPTT